LWNVVPALNLVQLVSNSPIDKGPNILEITDDWGSVSGVDTP